MTKHLTCGALLAAALAAWAVPARANDVHRLALLPADTRTLDLRADDAADVLDASFRRGYGYGGYRGGFGVGFGYRSPAFGYRGGYFAPYRSYYGYGYYGGYRPFYGYGAGYYGYYRPYYYPRVYSYPVYSYSAYSYPVYSYPTYYSAPTIICADRPAVPVMPRALSSDPLPMAPPPAITPERSPSPPMPPPRDDGTFPYDGGPRTPVPMPSAPPAEGGVDLTRTVSLNVSAGRWAYPAYGEAPRRITAPQASPFSGFAAPTFLMSR